MPPTSTKTPNALLHGALDALILKTFTRGPSHGYAVARFIEETTGDAFLIEDGSLYPALYRLERKGWVEAEWGTSELGRRAKLYRLTPQVARNWRLKWRRGGNSRPAYPRCLRREAVAAFVAVARAARSGIRRRDRAAPRHAHARAHRGGHGSGRRARDGNQEDG